MAPLTPYDRVMKFFKREPVDVMPFFTGMGMVLRPAIKKLGYKVSVRSSQCREAGLVGHRIGPHVQIGFHCYSL